MHVHVCHTQRDLSDVSGCKVTARAGAASRSFSSASLSPSIRSGSSPSSFSPPPTRGAERAAVLARILRIQFGQTLLLLPCSVSCSVQLNDWSWSARIEPTRTPHADTRACKQDTSYIYTRIHVCTYAIYACMHVHAHPYPVVCNRQRPIAGLQRCGGPFQRAPSVGARARATERERERERKRACCLFVLFK